ncbi:putative protein FAM210B-like [Homarus americanus]|uniref:Uncharacterized protein n=1 Tax=Homarus americanus TaxID=6706 RepID=A0A8J5T8U4_HOMAM|nr:putative protein FAM210B-like [Homarus americanus]
MSRPYALANTSTPVPTPLTPVPTPQRPCQHLLRPCQHLNARANSLSTYMCQLPNYPPPDSYAALYMNQPPTCFLARVSAAPYTCHPSDSATHVLPDSKHVDTGQRTRGYRPANTWIQASKHVDTGPSTWMQELRGCRPANTWIRASKPTWIQASKHVDTGQQTRGYRPANTWIQASKHVDTGQQTRGYRPANTWIQASEHVDTGQRTRGYRPANKARFSPRRTRDVSSKLTQVGSLFGSGFMSGQGTQGGTFNSGTQPIDSHIDVYDSRITVSLSSAPVHLNMPGGQWAQDDKYISADLHDHHPMTVSSGKKPGISNAPLPPPLVGMWPSNAAAEGSGCP